VNRLVGGEDDIQAGRRNPHALAAFADEKGFDGAALFVPARGKAESAQVEVGVELAVHARQQVLVEGCRHAGWIVVREFENRRVFLEVVAQYETVAWAQCGREQLAAARARRPV